MALSWIKIQRFSYIFKAETSIPKLLIIFLRFSAVFEIKQSKSQYFLDFAKCVSLTNFCWPPLVWNINKEFWKVLENTQKSTIVICRFWVQVFPKITKTLSIMVDFWDSAQTFQELLFCSGYRVATFYSNLSAKHRQLLGTYDICTKNSYIEFEVKRWGKFYNEYFAEF
jgi:hypothetical protein